MNIQKKTKVHFVGIGGIGMSAIAEVLLSLGHEVSGSDLNESRETLRLKNLGANIFRGHNIDNIQNTKDIAVVVYSSAINENNPEITFAAFHNIPIMKRAEMLAELMRLKHGIAIAGTHGKTTTTSILATILETADLDPTYVIGGIVKNLQGHAKVGGGDFLLAEADESDGTFLLLNPIISVITNIDSDHMDFYGTHENLVESFYEFAGKVPFYGVCALNAHDKTLMSIKKRLKKPWITYGIHDDYDNSENIKANYEAHNVVSSIVGTTFDLYVNGEFKQKIKMQIFGAHNVLNALAAISVASFMNIPLEKIALGISEFVGVGRRFQKVYEKNDFLIIDDYGHHPTEIYATINTARQVYPDKKLVVIFEPHRFTRTKDCWNEFLHCFNQACELYLTPIYAASELPIDGITSDRLKEDINKLHPNFCSLLPNVNELSQVLKKYHNTNTVVLTLGAGAISRALGNSLQELF